jgi:hypothetical protein
MPRATANATQFIKRTGIARIDGSGVLTTTARASKVGVRQVLRPLPRSCTREQVGCLIPHPRERQTLLYPEAVTGSQRSRREKEQWAAPGITPNVRMTKKSALAVTGRLKTHHIAATR